MIRRVVVNADDFGRSDGINRGITEAHEHGIVTSASLMVLWPAASDAAAYALEHPDLSVGLHVDLGEWVWRDGMWPAAYERADLTEREAVDREVRSQLERCRDLLARNPTHLDSHQHIHRREPARSVLIALANELGVPLRHFDPIVKYCGDFYGQDARGEPLPHLITTSHLISTLRRLPDGVTELACHPGHVDALESCYRTERATELRALCDAEVRQTLTDERIRLASFHDLNST